MQIIFNNLPYAQTIFCHSAVAESPNSSNCKPLDSSPSTDEIRMTTFA